LNKVHKLEKYNPFILKERVALKVMRRNYSGTLEGLIRSAHDLDPDIFTKGLQKGLNFSSKEHMNT